jgi:hypothetical protein
VTSSEKFVSIEDRAQYLVYSGNISTAPKRAAHKEIQ